MNKITGLISMLFLLPFLSSAQMPDAGSKSFTFGFNPLSTNGVNSNASRTGTLLYKYYPTPDQAFRFSASVGVNSSTNINDPGNGRKTTYSNSSNSFGLGLGFQKNLAAMDKFTVYAGGDLGLFYGSSKNSNRTDIYDHTKYGSGMDGDYTEIINSNINPLNIGIYPFLGMNYFITKNFSIGAEFSMGVIYSIPGSGTITTNQRSYGVDAPSVVTKTKTGGAFNITSNGGGLITGSVYF
jgi:hypothetical protein